MRRWDKTAEKKTQHGPDGSHIRSECRNLYAYSAIDIQETKRDSRRLQDREAFILITVTNLHAFSEYMTTVYK